MTQSIPQRRTLSAYLRVYSKRPAPRNWLKPYRVRIEEGRVSFIPPVYCSREL